MGRERTGARKYLFLCIAGLILLPFSGCVRPEKVQIRREPGKDVSSSLRRGQELLCQGDYTGAIRENERVLSDSGGIPPADEALFNLGLIYAHPQNPSKDPARSLGFFMKVMEEFPQSPLSEQARIWVETLQERERLNQVIEELSRTPQKPKNSDLFRMLEKPRKTEPLPPRPEVKIEERREIHESEARRSFLRAQRLLALGDYEGALKECQRSLSLSGRKPPGDEALFHMALIWAHPGNPKKDTGKAIRFFRRLTREHSQSPWAEAGKVWAEMLQDNEKLSRTVEELNRVIQRSKQVDIEIEEKKREKAK